MKKSILIIILTLFCITEIESQNDPILDDLNNPDIFIRLNALQLIKQDDLEEYIPVLVDLIFEQSEPLMIKNFMEVLAFLNYDEIGDIAYQFIEMADEFDNMFPKADPLEMKVTATEILFNIADYSTVNYVFELAERDYPFDQQSGLITVSMLGRIINEVPAYEEDAKEILLQSVNNSPNVRVRSIAISALYEKYTSELVETYVYVSVYDDDWAMRSLGMEILYEINYSQLNDLLRERIALDEQPETRIWIADDLLTWFGKPSDLKYLQDYLPDETDPTAELEISIEISTFVPPRPTAPTSEMITNLIGYTDEIFQYGWITEVSVYNQYLDYLKDIEKAYSNKEKELLCEKLTEFLNFTEGLHRSLLTEEGHKFMHYHGIYIKENVEDEFGKCE